MLTASRTLPRHSRKEKMKKTDHSQVGRGVCVCTHTHVHTCIIYVSLTLGLIFFIIGDLRALRTVSLILKLQYGGSSMGFFTLSICLSTSKSE